MAVAAVRSKVAVAVRRTVVGLSALTAGIGVAAAEPPAEAQPQPAAETHPAETRTAPPAPPERAEEQTPAPAAPPEPAPPEPAPAAPPPTALDRMREFAPTGKLKEITLDRARMEIPEALPVAGRDERPNRQPATAVQTRGDVEGAAHRAEAQDNLRDVELCRDEAARARGSDKLKAGKLVLRWTILPNGRTAEPVVSEQEATDAAVLECVRRRMRAWLFSPPDRAISLEYWYTFAPSARAAPIAPAAPRPPEGTRVGESRPAAPKAPAAPARRPSRSAASATAAEIGK